jgi:hypothetical protein
MDNSRNRPFGRMWSDIAVGLGLERVLIGVGSSTVVKSKLCTNVQVERLTRLEAHG